MAGISAHSMTILRGIGLALALVLQLALPAHADEAALRAIIAKFADAKGFPAIEAVVRELGATGDPAVAKVLTALSDGNFSIRKSDSQVFIIKEEGSGVTLLDPLSGEGAGQADKSELSKVKVNNGLRGALREVHGSIT